MASVWGIITVLAHVYGSIFQVVVDCRKDSPTYLQWEGFEIHKEKQKNEEDEEDEEKRRRRRGREEGMEGRNTE